MCDFTNDEIEKLWKQEENYQRVEKQKQLKRLIELRERINTLIDKILKEES